MDRLLSVVAATVAALGAHHLYRYMNRRGKSRTAQRRLDVWEGEGGAIPVSRSRTAAQVAPRRASPRADR
jgi:hypothetical protein